MVNKRLFKSKIPFKLDIVVNVIVKLEVDALVEISLIVVKDDKFCVVLVLVLVSIAAFVEVVLVRSLLVEFENILVDALLVIVLLVLEFEVELELLTVVLVLINSVASVDKVDGTVVVVVVVVVANPGGK